MRKLGAPSHEEYAVGAIAEGVKIVNPDAVRQGGVTAEQLAFVEDLERVELERRQRLFAASTPPIADRTAIVVDDGVATGATAMAACEALRAQGASRIILAVPVAPARWQPGPSVDEYICPHRIEDFWAVGQFYTDFRQTTDGEVSRLLSRDLPDRGIVARQLVRAERRVSRPTPPRSRARLWNALMSKAAPWASFASSRICSQMRCPTL